VDGAFYQLFNESAQHLVKGSALLAEMFAEGTDLAAKAKEMREAESMADATTRAIIQRVNTTFVTPFDREDIYALAYGLDDAMDEMEEAADLINLYGVAEYPEEFAKQVELIQRCAELTAAAMPRLQSMDLEKSGDKSFRRMISKLFGGNYEALEVLKLKDVVEKLEGAINAFETVAKRVEQIAVKES
jgi:uncharacterized protein Yka (UPF0111/DUF47 family)